MQNSKDIAKQEITVDKKLILELISLIDLTALGNTDTNATILDLVNTANTDFKGVHVAAVCTYSNYGTLVKNHLNDNIKIAVVGACFPTGQTLSAAKINEASIINQIGIDELDIVINRSAFFNGDLEEIGSEIKAIKTALGQKHLKVILETGELVTEDNIKKAAQIAIANGADFIKTSTGKSTSGATPEAVVKMCFVIKEHYLKTGKKIGIKPSGGIRTLDDALIYYKIVKFILGREWLNNDLFRIGASSLYNNLKQAYNKLP